jgi:hypothetical protein
MKTIPDSERIILIREALADLQSRKLSKGATLVAIGLIVSDPRPPNVTELQYAEMLARKYGLTYPKDN